MISGLLAVRFFFLVTLIASSSSKSSSTKGDVLEGGGVSSNVTLSDSSTFLVKDNGENIMMSIKEGPFQMGTVSDIVTGGTEGAVQQGPVRARVLNDLSAEEKERYKADIRATNILLQGIPKDIYSLINHYTDAKDIWENVKMIV
ncbi:hypothetical protein Tco_0960020, partial [Tanacetum coccineum]